MQNRMFKVISPIDKKDGKKYWMNCGTGYLNKDNSINMYVDALPVGAKDGIITLQLRELTEEEKREREAKRASYSARGTLGSSFQPPPLGMSPSMSSMSSMSPPGDPDSVPF